MTNGDYDTAIAAQGDLIKFLEISDNTQDQIDYWLHYSSNMSAVEGETIAEVIETEAIMAKMQGVIR